MDMLTETIKLLRRYDKPLTELAKETRLGSRWLAYVKRDEIPDPGIRKITRLYNYLSSRAYAKPKRKRAA